MPQQGVAGFAPTLREPIVVPEHLFDGFREQPFRIIPGSIR
jgi:hypothetical protein